MTAFTASFRPHGDVAAADGLLASTWAVEGSDRKAAMRTAMTGVGVIVGEADFAYRELADGSLTILDTLFGSTKIGTLRVAATRSARNH